MCNNTVADCFLAVEKDRRENPFFPVDDAGKFETLYRAVDDIRFGFKAEEKDKTLILAAKVIRCLEGF